MEFIKLKCPQCDADLEIEDGIDTKAEGGLFKVFKTLGGRF